MPAIFDESDPKAVPEAPKGRIVPDFMGAALEADANDQPVQQSASPDFIATDMTAEPQETTPPVQEKERGSENVEEATIVAEAIPEPQKPEPAKPEPEPEPEPEPVQEAEPEEPASITVEPGGGFIKGSGSDEAVKSVILLMRGLVGGAHNQSVPRERVLEYMTPLMQLTTRAERGAIREAVAAMQAEYVHQARFNDVVSVQHALDIIAENWTTSARTRKTKEEREYEKRIKNTREGATVLIATFELLKSITPEGVEILDEARKDSEALLVDVGQWMRWVESGKNKSDEPKISVHAKRALTAFRAAVKGVTLEDHLRPSTHEVVTVKDKANEVSTPDEETRESNVRVHVEELFARLDPTLWVSVQQIVDKESNEFPTKELRPEYEAVKAVIYANGQEGVGVKGVEGYTADGVEGGWKPVG